MWSMIAIKTATASLVLSLSAGSFPVLSQEWPTRAVTLVVPYAAGGANDAIARIVAPHLSDVLRQQVVIENVGGAGGMIGSLRVAKAAPDGYQFVLGSVGTHAQNQSLFKQPRYDAATDFAPVALIVDQPLVLIVRKDLPAGDLREFIAHARTHQAKMQYGSAGAGSVPHLACALLNAAIGIDVTHIAYRGGGPAMQDLIAGRIDYQCPNAAPAIPQIEGKLVKPVAILTRERSSVLPDIASAHEQGLGEFSVENWNALFLPKRTPAAIVHKLNEATSVVVNRPAVQARLRELGAVVVAPERRSPEFLQQFVRNEIAKWAVTIRKSGLALE